MIAHYAACISASCIWAVSTVAATKQVEPKDAPKGGINWYWADWALLQYCRCTYYNVCGRIIQLAGIICIIGIIINNLVAFIALAVFVPSMPATENTASGKPFADPEKGQLWVNYLLPLLWLRVCSLLTDYLAEYLGKISHMSGGQIQPDAVTVLAVQV